MTDRPATDAIVNGALSGDAAATAPSSSMRHDLASAYLVTAARVAAWATISALVYRRLGRDAFAMLALVRSTVGLLAYTSVGLAPAMVRALAEAGRPRPTDPSPAGVEVPAAAIQPGDSTPIPIIAYETPKRDSRENDAVRRVYASGVALAFGSAAVGIILSILYGKNCPRLHAIPLGLEGDTVRTAVFFGFGMVVRLMSEAPSSLLQVRGRVAWDNLLLAAAEVVWVAGAVLFAAKGLGLTGVGLSFLLAGVLLLVGRNAAAASVAGFVAPRRALAADARTAGRLLAFGLGVAVAQAADYLYAPTDYILINRLIGPATVAVYAPAVQIDSGLLLIVNGLAGVLLPHSALAHAAGNRAAVRRYYVRGTLASFALLAPVAVAVWLASPLLLRAWLGSSLPETRAILPLVLLSSVVGGSSAVGRSVLLAMGKVKPFTASVLAAGAANVILSIVFVRFLHLGLRGIILGTVVAVVGRCALWMPWHVLRALREPEKKART